MRPGYLRAACTTDGLCPTPPATPQPPTADMRAAAAATQATSKSVGGDADVAAPATSEASADDAATPAEATDKGADTGTATTAPTPFASYEDLYAAIEAEYWRIVETGTHRVQVRACATRACVRACVIEFHA